MAGSQSAAGTIRRFYVSSDPSSLAIHHMVIPNVGIIMRGSKIEN